jgi:hypothetical protein
MQKHSYCVFLVREYFSIEKNIELQYGLGRILILTYVVLVVLEHALKGNWGPYIS